MNADPPAIQFVGNQVLIRIPKALLVLSRAQFIEALKQGKAYRRRESRAKRERQTTHQESADDPSSRDDPLLSELVRLSARDRALAEAFVRLLRTINHEPSVHRSGRDDMSAVVVAPA